MTQQINLIDATAQGGRDWLTGLVVLGVGAVAAVAVGAHYFYEYKAWQTIVLTSAPPEDAAADPAAAASDPLSLQLQLAEAELAGGERLQQAVAALVDAPRDTAPRLQSLVAAMPAGMWLKEVEFVGSHGLRISGAALNSGDLSLYSARLSATPAFAGLPVRVLAVDHKAAKPADTHPAEEGETVTVNLDAAGVPETVAYYSFELSSLEAGSGESP